MTLFTWGIVGLLIVGLVGLKFTSSSTVMLTAIVISALGFIGIGVSHFLKSNPLLGAVFVAIAILLFVFVYFETRSSWI